MPVDLALLSAAFAAGAATFFSPCSVALVPAYAGFFLGLDQNQPRPTRKAAVEGSRFGGAAAVGILALFALGGLALYLVRAVLAIAVPQLGTVVAGLGLTAGVIVLALGVVSLLDRGPRVQPKLPAPRRRTLSGMAGFGVVFALGSLGCSLPVLFAILVQAFTQSAVGLVATVLAYGAGLAVLMAAAGVLLSIARDEATRRIEAARRYARPASGWILVGAGVYMIGYYVTSVPL